MLPKVVIIAAGSAEAKLVIQLYSPRFLAAAALVAADIPAALVFEHQPLKFSHLSDFLPRRTTKADGLSFKLVTAFLNHPTVQAKLTIDNVFYLPIFTETLRHRVQSQLTEMYNLATLCRSTKAHTLIVGQSFSKHTLRQLTSASKLRLKFLPQSSQVWLERLKLKFARLFQSFNEVTLLLARHPLVTARAFYYWLRPLGLSQARIAIFSNGLHLASYHSLIERLNIHHSLAVITDPPALLDRFYLAQYRLRVTPVKLKVTHPENTIVAKLRHRLKDLAQVEPPPRSLPPWCPQTAWKALLKEELERISGPWLDNTLAKFTSASRILTRVNPHLLITTHEPGPTATAFWLAAKQRHLHTLVLLHGSPSKNHIFFSDREFVWGPWLKKYLVLHRVPAHRLVVGGQPIFFDYQQFFKGVGALPAIYPPKIGILISGYGANEPHQLGYFLDLLPDLAKYIPAAEIIIRTHPQQYLDGIEDFSRQIGLNLKVNPAQTVEEFIASCQVVITQTSTAALIAGLSNRPVVYFPAFHPLLDQGALWHFRPFFPATSANQAAKLVKRLLKRCLTREESQRQQKFLRHFYGSIDSTLSSQLAATIAKLYSL
jgi:hypothetical protein